MKAALTAALILGAAPALAQDVTIPTARGEAALPAAPESVVVYDLAALDTLDALGVGVDGVPDMIGVDYLDETAAEAQVVGTLFEPDFEAVNALSPDLAIVGGRSATQYDALSGMVPTIDMTIPGESLVETGLSRIDAYGTLFRREAEAADLRQRLEDRIATAQDAVEGRGDGLIVLTNGPKVSAYGAGTRFGWLHTTLGLPEAADTDSAGRHGQPVSFEFIANADPDWLIVIDRAAAIGAEGARAEATLDNPLVAGTTAWEAEQVIYLDPADTYLAGGGAQSMARTLDTMISAFGGAGSDS
ncbi:iron complex transport system substrate-binding protein [Tranquillimonas rosea]|uniref:Iron complex transport system substrate-binding protein n=1 Tax=Tranquillimonas rosea TaxID=641238 RepID=A0A1H9XA44_9RHOB|nr:siderophore ABC transporter substrate-binding protein [Tranquillimonas rosea]SES43066.1 iron complex transport system substrate-binding protein [Tranquillimonas rosea]